MTTSRYQLYDVPGVEIFAAGDYPDGRVTADDLRQVVRNYYQLRTLHKPPVGLGHDEDQAKVPALLNSDARPWFAGPTGSNRSDAPAAGWCRNLRYVPDAQGGTIVADFSEVPEPIARLIEARSYRKVSAEIYTLNDGMGGKHPNTLRRVSLEGFTPPVVKRLADLPLPVPAKQYAERPIRSRLTPCKRSTSGTGVVYFSEVTMNDQTATPTEGQETPREEMIEALAKMGEDAAQLSQLSDADLKALYMKKMAEAKGSSQTPPVAGGQPSAGEVAKQYAEAQKMVAEAKKYAEEAKRERKLATIETHLNRLSQAGKVTPAERDGIANELADLDDTTVRKFAENGKQYAETPFAAKIRRLNERRPVVKFGERLADPAADPNATALDHEKEQVRQYAEQNEGALKAFGKTVNEFVNGFEALHKAGRVRAAAEYTGVK